MNCPHCNVKMEAHGDANPFKTGAHHCNKCGCCLLQTGFPREGTAGCVQWTPPAARVQERAFVEEEAATETVGADATVVVEQREDVAGADLKLEDAEEPEEEKPKRRPGRPRKQS